VRLSEQSPERRNGFDPGPDCHLDADDSEPGRRANSDEDDSAPWSDVRSMRAVS